MKWDYEGARQHYDRPLKKDQMLAVAFDEIV
jgi:hypothetical protein